MAWTEAPCPGRGEHCEHYYDGGPCCTCEYDQHPVATDAAADDCPYCGGSGWVTCVDLDGESAYETACPEGCSTVQQPLDDDAEVPF